MFEKHIQTKEMDPPAADGETRSYRLLAPQEWKEHRYSSCQAAVTAQINEQALGYLVPTHLHQTKQSCINHNTKCFCYSENELDLLAPA